MRRLLLLAALLLSACATRAPVDLTAVWDDARYANVTEPNPEALWALSPDMQRFVHGELRQAVRRHGPQWGLYRALMDQGHLRLEYDGTRTRTAAEAFEARAGNCLSLVLMTAALARELRLNVQFQLVDMADIWTRSEHFTLLNGHLNLSLTERALKSGPATLGAFTVDFQPFDDPHRVRVTRLAEETVVAMYFNNRAVEQLEAGEPGQAYQSLRAALRSDPRHLNALNTLAVLHRRQGDLHRAEASLRLLLAEEPDNQHAANNLVLVLEAAGRTEEARALARRLPPGPFADLERGLALARAERWSEAVQAFQRQLQVSPEFHGLHLELARAYLKLGHLARVRQHLQTAQQLAPSPAWRQAYEGKLKALAKLGRS